MSSDTVVRARIDGRVKKEATDVLAKMGLTVSDAIRIMLMRVAAERAMPFAVRVPNATTEAAIREAQRGGLASYESVDDFMASLNEAD